MHLNIHKKLATSGMFLQHVACFGNIFCDVLPVAKCGPSFRRPRRGPKILHCRLWGL